MNKNKSIIILIVFVIFLLIPVRAADTLTSFRIYPKKINIGIVSANNYDRGYKEKIQGNILLVTDTSNDWKVLVKTNDDNMGVIGNYTKPISDFYWKAKGKYATQITYKGVTNYDVEVARGSKGLFKIVITDYKILLSWAKDVPGNYKLTVVYTLTTQ